MSKEAETKKEEEKCPVCGDELRWSKVTHWGWFDGDFNPRSYKDGTCKKHGDVVSGKIVWDDE